MASTDSLQPVARTRLVTAQAIRDLTGWTAPKDVADASIEANIDRAQATTLQGIARYRRLDLQGVVDGTNTSYQVPRGASLRVIVDANLDEASNASDVRVWLVKRSTAGGADTYTEATVATVDAVNGVITLNAAPASDVWRVVLEARFVGQRFDKDVVQNAIAYLAAHLTDKAARRPGKVNLTNPGAGKKDQDNSPQSGWGRSWLSLHKAELKKLRFTRGRAASQRTRLGGGALPPETLL